MADFGPRIFHALAHLADADAAPGAQRDPDKPYFQTQKNLAKCGFEAIEYDEKGNEINVVERVETLKNAVFKTLMMRVRNKLYLHYKANGQKLDQCDVTLTLRVSSDFLHGIMRNDLDDDSLISNKTMDSILGGENKIQPMDIDFALPDSAKSVSLAVGMKGVCAGNKKRVEKAFEKDIVFTKHLPDFNP